MAKKIWFITGASRGFGRIWAEAALARGDSVAATARNPADVADLKERFGKAVLPMALDVTRADQVQQTVREAHGHFGRLDVVMNNAGYTLVATAEEATEAEVRALFDTNYFGALSVIQAALPLLRQQRSGHIIGVSSGLGLVTLPLVGFYCATKWAFEALHESLAQEVAEFNIKVTLLEPGAYATGFSGPASRKQATAMAAYTPLREQFFGRLSNMERGDPQATAEAVLKIVDADKPPLRIILGANLPWVRGAYADRLKTWEEWEALSAAAQGQSRKEAVTAH